MRILILQFVPDVRGLPTPRFSPPLGTLLTLLRQRGHELSLLGLSRFNLEALKATLARALPQLIYADVSSVCTDLARRCLHYISEHEFLPIVAGGAYPTVDPAGCLSLPGVHAVAIGEPDASLVTYLERLKDPAINQVVSGVWLRDERGTARPDLPPLVEDLDSLPPAERDLFAYAEYVRRTGQIEIAIGRGCPQQCAYCINDWLEEIYENRGTWVRRRSPENILAEIANLRTRYPEARLVRFLDHSFALDESWLVAFLAAYVPGCNLPFRCHLRANAVTPGGVRRLAAAGCELADIEVISGSDFIRNEIFDMDLSGEQIAATFAMLRDAGVRTRAIVYLGSPYESEASLDETRNLLLSLRPDVVDVRAYYPFPGTRARDTAGENGWLHRRGEEQYHLDACGIDIPACRPDRVSAFVRRLRSEFPVEGGAPWWRRWPSQALTQLFTRRRG